MGKLLLLGTSKAGKTSMYSIIFAHRPVRETMGIGYTVGIEQKTIKFMGNLSLNLWDCGGQDILMKSYFNSQKEQIFSDVDILLYVLDVQNKGEEEEKDLSNYRSCIELLATYSENAKVFVFINKMDMIPFKNRVTIFDLKKELLEEQNKDVQVNIVDYFSTSIWEDTLYNAWCNIISYIVPYRDQIQEQLSQLCQVSDVDEILLFEKSSFLIVSHYKKNEKNNLNCERISNILKQFKVFCIQQGSFMKELKFNKGFQIQLKEFNENSYLMMISHNKSKFQGIMEYNLNFARNNLKIPFSQDSY